MGWNLSFSLLVNTKEEAKKGEKGNTQKKIDPLVMKMDLLVLASRSSFTKKSRGQTYLLDDNGRHKEKTKKKTTTTPFSLFQHLTFPFKALQYIYNLI